MNNSRGSVGPLSEETGQRTSRGEIRTFRLGDVGLIDVAGAPARDGELERALLWEWAASPSGVLIRINADGPVDEGTVRTVTSAGDLVHAWPGTPIGVITASPDLRERVATDPRGNHLATGTTMAMVWEGMWSRGLAVNITIELPPSARAPRTARDTAARACLDWSLNTLAGPAALVTGDLVTRSVIHGARDIHFTVSRHHSLVRVLIRDDAHSTSMHEPRSIDDVFGVQFPTPAMSELTDSLGEFALDGHHVRWAVMRNPPSTRRSA